jgi:hypothetical protein
MRRCIVSQEIPLPLILLTVLAEALPSESRAQNQCARDGPSGTISTLT